ncbi:uncharacterized protein LOC122503053 [Leptopilina heterotoma]|uniref:uncharacterized protein LOC122503053 n=1 Tax=Leptopilina heterotoma TaxID=63436 RepID=UPI001CA922E8|nr:uncharacterized protein LOC122503053 [Leptopilina heterotoma]
MTPSDAEKTPPSAGKFQSFSDTIKNSCNDNFSEANKQIMLETQEQAVVLSPSTEKLSTYNAESIEIDLNLNTDVIIVPFNDEVQEHTEILKNIEEVGELTSPVTSFRPQNLHHESSTTFSEISKETCNKENFVSVKTGYKEMTQRCKLHTKKISELKKEVKALRLCNSQTEVIITEKDKEIAKLREEVNKLRNLNYAHQDLVIDSVQEFRVTLQERNRQLNLSNSTLEPSVGRRTVDGKKMHMGRGV